MKQRIVLFANTDWYLYNFRLGLARRLSQLGHEVVLVAPGGRYLTMLSTEFDVHHVALGGGSMNPWTNLKAVRQIRAIYRQVQPDLVHHFTIKCVLYGGLVSRRYHIPTVNAVTGLGHIFTEDSLTNYAVRGVVQPMYRYVLNGKKTRVIYQNAENRDFFLEKQLVDPQRVRLIRGSGADCERFRPQESGPSTGTCRFLFASRLIHEKGIRELLAACRLLKSRQIPFELLVAGDIYPGNPSSLTPAELSELKQECTFLGHVDDMAPIFAQADVVVLPSYAEGTPRVLLEAGACGKPLIATDIAGCRGVVEPGVNGTLVPPRAVEPLTDAMQELIENPELRLKFGRASREIILEQFSEERVIAETLDVYRELLPDVLPN